jgi:hypothetical protein
MSLTAAVDGEQTKGSLKLTSINHKTQISRTNLKFISKTRDNHSMTNQFQPFFHDNNIKADLINFENKGDEPTRRR